MLHDTAVLSGEVFSDYVLPVRSSFMHVVQDYTIMSNHVKIYQKGNLFLPSNNQSWTNEYLIPERSDINRHCLEALPPPHRLTCS